MPCARQTNAAVLNTCSWFLSRIRLKLWWSQLWSLHVIRNFIETEMFEVIISLLILYYYNYWVFEVIRNFIEREMLFATKTEPEMSFVTTESDVTESNAKFFCLIFITKTEPEMSFVTTEPYNIYICFRQKRYHHAENAISVADHICCILHDRKELRAFLRGSSSRWGSASRWTFSVNISKQTIPEIFLCILN